MDDHLDSSKDIREITNPHDLVTIDCTHIDAARLAVLIMGQGLYGLKDGKDPAGNILPGMPLFINDGDADKWVKDTYNMELREWMDSVDLVQLCEALNSVTQVTKSSRINIAHFAHITAASLKTNNPELFPNG